MGPTRALCITGMPGCGKEEFLLTASKAGYTVIRMGDVVREEAARRGIQPTDEGIGGMAHNEREVHGLEVWAVRTLERVDVDQVVIDGVRSLDEVAYFQRTFGNAIAIVAVHASPRTRLARITERGREDDILSEEEFHRRDRRELKWGLGEVIALADYVIVNEGELKEFHKEAQRVLRQVFG